LLSRSTYALFGERLQARQKQYICLEKRRFLKNRRINAFVQRILFNAFFALNRWFSRKRRFLGLLLRCTRACKHSANNL